MSTNRRAFEIFDCLKWPRTRKHLTRFSLEKDNQTTTGQQEAQNASTQTPQTNLPTLRDNECLPSVQAWTTWGGCCVVATVLVGMIGGGAIKYKTTVKAQATLRPSGELHLVQATAAGVVKEIWVKENQQVKQGDIIASLDNSSLEIQKSQLQSQIQQAKLQLTQLNGQIQAIDSQMFAEQNRANRAVSSAKAEFDRRNREHQDQNIVSLTEVQEAQANLKSARSEWERAKAQLQSDQADLNAAIASLKVLRKQLERYQNIASVGALSHNQLEEAQIAVEQQEYTVEIQENTIKAQKQVIKQQEQSIQAATARLQRAKTALNPTQADMEIALEDIAQERAIAQATQAALIRERESLMQQRTGTQKQLERDQRQLQQIELDLTKMKVIATAQGSIARLNLRNPGQMVNSGQEIAQLIPENTSLVIEASILPSEISQIEVGQAVQMQVSACPYPDYGTLPGVVSQISQDTMKSSEVDASNLTKVNQRTAFYKVTIKPTRFVLGTGENVCSVQLGMEGRANIISKEESLLQFLLRKARLLSNI
ncbi:MAG: HlyD family efflux transporter periplasmic adaptor subunit [Crocosphaera sp.]|nr:HlyD family efflux transporter periplasmic adaptor subunit [Crocosphaera sp.]